MRYKCVVRDSMDVWLTEGNIYVGEPAIPPVTDNEAWIKLYAADDGFPCFVRAKQMERIFSNGDSLEV